MIMHSRETAVRGLGLTLILKLGGFGVAHGAQNWRGKPPRRNSSGSILSADGLSGVFDERRTKRSIQTGVGEADFHRKESTILTPAVQVVSFRSLPLGKE